MEICRYAEPVKTAIIVVSIIVAFTGMKWVLIWGIG